MPSEDKDLRILSELLKNSDRPQKSLSNIIGVSESEFTRRKQHMADLGIIKKYTIDIDYEKLGYVTVGYFIFSEHEKDTDTAANLVTFLRSIPEIIEISQVFGKDVDFVLKLMCKSNHDFHAIAAQIRSHPNVRSDGSYSAIIADTNKNEPGAPILEAPNPPNNSRH